jgi:CD109 antigen
LEAMIVGDISTKQSVKIYTISRQFSIFVQTDKAVYKPGDKVQYRVLAIDFETKPFIMDTIKVQILNGAGTEVFLINKVPNKSVFIDNFPISENTLLGEWQIIVTVNRDKIHKTKYTFRVEKYILPQFEVLTSTKNHFKAGEKYVSVDVAAKYTFGDAVKGLASITAKVYDPKFPDTVHSMSTKNVSVRTRESQKFDVISDLKVENSIRSYIVKFDVFFEETHTHHVMNASTSTIILTPQDLKIEFVPQTKYFRPGFPFRVQTIIKKFDGSIDTSQRERILFKITKSYKPPHCTKITDPNFALQEAEENKEMRVTAGQAYLDLDIPKNATTIQILATYGKHTASISIDRYLTNTREYLLVNLTKPR